MFVNLFLSDILLKFTLNLCVPYSSNTPWVTIFLQYKRGRDRKHITDIKETVVSYYIPLSMISGCIQHGMSSVNASYDLNGTSTTPPFCGKILLYYLISKRVVRTKSEIL
jgi:hypothetical protein